ncbi:MAG: type II toxin-antitoxin system RelE/ParE family toxin [Brevundimonas sp.]|uniref:type II toxin-antitoxin system RelE/ParE family toxin n=1 Tax=Brevundimonas sp. TaxID=1871086 RepID=UPI00351D0566
MKYTVRLGEAVDADLQRLAEFIGQHSETAARRCVVAIQKGVTSLEVMPNRHPIIRDNRRELYIPFGASGYVVQYRVDLDVVVVARIFHSREDR